MTNKEIEKLLSESPGFSDSPEVDILYDMFLRMLQEIAVLQEELYMLKVGLEKKGIDLEEIKQAINEEESHAKDLIEQHKEMLSRVIKDLK